MRAILFCIKFLGLIQLVKLGRRRVAEEKTFEECNGDIPKDQVWEIDVDICKGKRLWSNGTDLMLCRTHIWNNCLQEGYREKDGFEWTCGYISSRCNKPEGGGWPGQCVGNDKLSDQEYSCLDRSDTGKSGGKIDFRSMIRCRNMGEDFFFLFFFLF